MNTMVLLICLSLVFISQQSTVNKKYIQAFRYIQTAQETRAFCRAVSEIDNSFPCKMNAESHSDSHICIAVSDSIISLSELFFFDKIIAHELKGSKLNMRSLKDSLYVTNLQIDFNPLFLPSLRELPSCTNARLILFFDKPERNRLTAELLPYYGGSSKNFSSMRQFNRSLQFLFYFSPRDSIEKVITVQFQYD